MYSYKTNVVGMTGSCNSIPCLWKVTVIGSEKIENSQDTVDGGALITKWSLSGQLQIIDKFKRV